MRLVSGLRALAASVTVLCLVSTSACGSEVAVDGPEEGVVNIIAYSGVWQDAYTAAVIEPFKAQHPKITVNYVSKRSSAEMLSALQGEKSTPNTDVSIMDISVSTSGNSQGLFAKLSADAVPNLANVKPEFRREDGYGPAVNVDAIGLLYDTTAVTSPPTSWAVLWDAQYQGKVNVVAPPSLLGLSLTAITATMEGEDFATSIDKATARLKQLAPSISSFAPNPDEYQSIITGQTVLGLGQNGRAQYYHDASGGKLGVAFPSEGTVYQTNTINLVANAPHPQAAQTFVNYALSAEAQEAFAAQLYYAPTVSNAVLPADVASRVVPTDGSLTIIPLDVDVLAAQRSAWTDVWKREVIPAAAR